MKNRKTIVLVIMTITILVGIASNFISENRNIINKQLVIKEMAQSELETQLNSNIEQLNAEHTEYSKYIEEGKAKIANAINLYPNNNATAQNSLEEFSTMINNLTNIPEDTYYYEQGTEGNSSTIVRYKKVDNSYYLCDANGIILEGTSAIDVSSKTLISYNAFTTGNMSVGSAGYASGSLYLGDGSDNVAYLEQNGSKVYNLGTGTSFDIKALTGLSDEECLQLTSDNFVIELSNASVTYRVTMTISTGTWYSEMNYNCNGCYSNISITKNYNSSTGILNAYGTLNNYIPGSGGEDYIHPSSATTNVSCKAILIMD